MSGNSERPKSSQESSVFKCNKAEGYDHEENCFLMDMPTKKKRGISAKRDCSNKGIPSWLDKKFKEAEL